MEHQATQEVIDQAALAHLDFNPVHTNIPWNEQRPGLRHDRDGGARHVHHVPDGLGDRPGLAARRRIDTHHGEQADQACRGGPDHPLHGRDHRAAPSRAGPQRRRVAVTARDTTGDVVAWAISASPSRTVPHDGPQCSPMAADPPSMTARMLRWRRGTRPDAIAISCGTSTARTGSLTTAASASRAGLLAPGAGPRGPGGGADLTNCSSTWRLSGGGPVRASTPARSTRPSPARDRSTSWPTRCRPADRRRGPGHQRGSGAGSGAQALPSCRRLIVGGADYEFEKLIASAVVPSSWPDPRPRRCSSRATRPARPGGPRAACRPMGAFVVTTAVRSPCTGTTTRTSCSCPGRCSTRRLPCSAWPSCSTAAPCCCCPGLTPRTPSRPSSNSTRLRSGSPCRPCST